MCRVRREVEQRSHLVRRQLEVAAETAIAACSHSFMLTGSVIQARNTPAREHNRADGSAAVLDRTRRRRAHSRGAAEDVVAVEEPLEIRIGGVPVAVTMRTPGHDEELALGFALSEGLARAALGRPDDLAANTSSSTRRVSIPSACGAASTRRRPAASAARARSRQSRSRPRASRATFTCRRSSSPSLPERLREEQAAFAATGGLHATGLFDADGELLALREDVGRHNAMDKVIGRAFLDGRLPLADAVLCVSGRLSFELVQKAAVAGCPVLVAVGAPSSLAVELARDRGVTLCGFVRGGRLNVYSEPWRIGG